MTDKTPGDAEFDFVKPLRDLANCYAADKQDLAARDMRLAAADIIQLTEGHLAAVTAERDRLRQELRDESHQLEGTITAYDNVTADRNDLRKRINNLSEQLAAVTAERDDACAKLDDHRGLLRARAQKIDAVTAENARLADEMSAAEAENERLKAAIAALADEWDREANRDDALAMDPDNEPIAAEDYHDSAMVHRNHAAALRKLAG